MDHFSSQMALGEPIEVVYGYQLIPLVRIETYFNPPIFSLTLIPTGMFIISDKGIQLTVLDGGEDKT